MDEPAPVTSTLEDVVAKFGLARHPTVNASGLRVVVLARLGDGRFETMWHGLIATSAASNPATLITDWQERLFSLERAVDALDQMRREAQVPREENQS